MFKNILVSVDGSDSAAKALAAAGDIAQQNDANLHILHVVRDMQVPLTPGIMEAYEKLQRQRHDVLREAGEQLLNQAKRSVEAKGVKTVDTDIGSGDPASAIVTYAGRNNIDLIVLGSRGLGNVEGMLMGSVSRKVSNTAKTSCLVIK